MRNSFDYYKQVEKPNMYLCNPNQKPIGAVNAENRHLTLRFNDLSELTFTVPKIKGTERVYSRIETRRLIFVEQIGWFQITNVTDNVDGNYESKDVTCESHQAQLKTRGFASEERVYMFYNPNDPLDTLYDSSNVGAIPSIIGQLYQQIGLKVNLSIGDVEVDHDYVDWTVIYIDEALKFKSKNYGDLYVADDAADNICRTFSEETTFGYDFIVNKVEQAFEVVFEFDFLYHTISITLSGAGAKEVGTEFTPSYSTSFNKGSYSYEPKDTGVSVTKYEITDTDGNTASTASGSFTKFTVDDDTNYSITAKITYSDGAIAKTNLENDSNPVVRIAAGSLTKTSAVVTGYRPMFTYVGTDVTTLDGAWVRSKGSNKGNSVAPGDLSIAEGTKRVMFAVPKAKNKTLKSVIDVDGMGLDVKDNFTHMELEVAGANGHTAAVYDVWYVDNANGLSKTTYKVTLG